MVSGVDKVLFWVTSYLSDLINYLIPFTLIFICFAAFNQAAFTVRLAEGTVGLHQYHRTSTDCPRRALVLDAKHPTGRFSTQHTSQRRRRHMKLTKQPRYVRYRPTTGWVVSRCCCCFSACRPFL
jgi:hypothetical protein